MVAIVLSCSIQLLRFHCWACFDLSLFDWLQNVCSVIKIHVHVYIHSNERIRGITAAMCMFQPWIWTCFLYTKYFALACIKRSYVVLAAHLRYIRATRMEMVLIVSRWRESSRLNPHKWMSVCQTKENPMSWRKKSQGEWVLNLRYYVKYIMFVTSFKTTCMYHLQTV